jgi:hypothetical protein
LLTRETKSRLQLSLIATKRLGGKVRHEHVGSLGSVPIPFDAYDRTGFRQKLRDRWRRLNNRMGSEPLGAIMSAIHARKLPMTSLQNPPQ